MDVSLKALSVMIHSPLQGLVTPAMEKKKVILSTDSRSLKKSNVYWALQGERFDAHRFVEDCQKKGSLASVVNRAWFEKNQKNQNQLDQSKAYLVVEDTNKSLLTFAHGYAKNFSIPKVAITGSNGKTTTKDMIMAVLKTKGAVHGTEKNLNNQFGVPFTLFGLNKKHRALVVEMGTNHPGEIEPLSRTVEASIGVITNVSYNHVEHFKTLKGVYQEKVSLIKGLSSECKVIVNGDDPLLSRLRSTKKREVIFFGINKGSIQARSISYNASGCAGFTVGRTKYQLKVPGVHNIYNALAAIAVALQLKVSPAKIAEALAKFKSSGRRMAVLKIAGIQVFDDCYNASPASMEAALTVLKESPTKGSRYAVLGDMLELGELSESLHRALGASIAHQELEGLFTFGKESEYIGKEALALGTQQAVKHFSKRALLNRHLKKVLKRGDVVLIKGSRGMQLERVTEFLKGSLK